MFSKELAEIFSKYIYETLTKNGYEVEDVQWITPYTIIVNNTSIWDFTFNNDGYTLTEFGTEVKE